MTTMLNGWDVEAVQEAVATVQQQPEAGRVAWRGRAVWDGGFGLSVHTEEVEQLGSVMERHFTLRGDHPPELLGNNTGATAIETCLAALGSCMTGTFAVQATARGVHIEELEVDLACTIDLNGFFGIRPVGPELRDVALTFRVRSDADDATLNEILDAARSLSPVYNTVTRPVEVAASVAPSSDR